MSVELPLGNQIHPEVYLQKRKEPFSAFHLVSINGKLYSLSVTSLEGDSTTHHALDKDHWEKIAQTVQGIFHSTKAMASHDPACVSLMQDNVEKVSIPLLDTKKTISFLNTKNEKEEYLSENQMTFLKKDHPIADFRHDFMNELSQVFRNPSINVHRHLDRLSDEKRIARQDKLSTLATQMHSLNPSLRQLAAPIFSSVDHKKEHPDTHALEKEYFEVLTNLFDAKNTFLSPIVSLDDLCKTETSLQEYCKALALNKNEFIYLPLLVDLEAKKPFAKKKQTLGLYIDRKARKLYLYDPLARKIKNYPQLNGFFNTLIDHMFKDDPDKKVRLVKNAGKAPHQSYYPKSSNEKSLHNPNESFVHMPNEEYNSLRYQLAFLEKMTRNQNKDKAFHSFTSSTFHREQVESFAKEFSERVTQQLTLSYESALITGN